MAGSAKRIIKLSQAALRVDADCLTGLAEKTDAEIVAAIADDPQAPPVMVGDDWRGAGIILPEKSVLLSIRVDRDVLKHFRGIAPTNPEAAMASVLRAHVEKP